MSGWMWFLVSGVAVAFLIFNLIKLVSADRLAAFSARRRASSQLVSLGELVDGNRHMDVALALTEAAFIYENSDLSGSLDRKWIQEVEYENELSTGKVLDKGKVLRIRCFSKTFEFVLPFDVVRQWEVALPPQR